jgi:hypothetical protein
MYDEKEPVVLPFAADRKDAVVQCVTYAAVFAGLGALLVWAMAWKDYSAAKMAPILAIFLAVSLATWLPMLLRCVAKLHLEPEGVRITAWGLTLRRYPLGKIRFISAMECSGKNRTTTRSQILLCAHTYEELTKKGGWRDGSSRKPKTEFARNALYRFQNAYYVRELNLTKDILWLDWSPDRIRLIRWLYPDAQWMDFSLDHVFEKQMND